MELHMDRLPKSVSLTGNAESGVMFTYIDERKLPYELVMEQTQSWEQVIDAVKTLAVRGAPAIGLAGASAMVLWAAMSQGNPGDLPDVAERVANARPTAVNLKWAVDRTVAFLEQQIAAAGGCVSAAVVDAGVAYVHKMEQEDEACNRAMGDAGAQLLKPGSRILTHCNAGSLGTYFYGTALGVVYSAAAQGKVERVYADETRPVGQGARLTVWELSRVGIPTTLICDNMAASLMAKGAIDAVIVGADRITRNGDVANKIGTYGVAVNARHHGIPFYVAAPSSTFDLSLDSGAQIPIEQRSPQEVLPRDISGVDVYNPAFDVTPAALITGIITEKGVFAPGEAALAVSA